MPFYEKFLRLQFQISSILWRKRTFFSEISFIFQYIKQKTQNFSVGYTSNIFIWVLLWSLGHAWSENMGPKLGIFFCISVLLGVPCIVLDLDWKIGPAKFQWYKIFFKYFFYCGHSRQESIMISLISFETFRICIID